MQPLAPHTISHNGVPVGLVELPLHGERFTLPMHPLTAYAAIQSRVAAPQMLAHFTTPSCLAARWNCATPRARSFPWITSSSRTGPAVPLEVAAFIRIREAHAPVPARVPPKPVGGSDSSSPRADVA